jgi:integrase/recombinase XerD
LILKIIITIYCHTVSFSFLSLQHKKTDNRLTMKFTLTIRANRIKANGTTSVLLRISKNKIDRYILTGYDSHPEGWNKESEQIDYSEIYSKKDLIKINRELISFKNRYKSCFENEISKSEQKSISVDSFIEKIEPRKVSEIKSENFFDHLDKKIQLLKKEGRYGTAKYYHDSRNSIVRFNNGSVKLNFDKIDIDWLKKYEHHLKLRKCKDSGIAVKMRAIRAIYNEAIDSNSIISDKYPFAKYKISKLKGEINIRAISLEDMQLIKNLSPELYPKLMLTRDLFLFGYYAGGLNYKDLILLKHSDISKENRLVFYREKTKGLFDYKLSEEALKILEFYKKNRTNTQFVFPVLLEDNMTPNQIFNRHKKTLTQFNRNLKEIGRVCNIDFDLTSYVLRHSFASNLRDLDVSSEIISEIMHNGNTKMTNHYLKRINNTKIDSAFAKLK